KYTVSADSANDVYWNAVAFTVSGSLGNGTNLLTIGTDATSTTADGIYIIVAAGDDTQAVSNIKLYNTGTGTQVAGTFTYRADTNATGYTLYFVSTAEETVAKGTTKTYEVRGDFNISNAGTSGLGSISTKISDLSAAVQAGAAAATVEASSADSFTTTTTTAESFVWSDGSSVAPVHSLTSLDWTNDWKVAGVPTTTLTLK
ncbi:MAG: hypothetical protein PHF44_04690, partial [Candidatus Pacebacteria bacterium]|nr:hypothetical protein [Candidatus Paceibacterota bacterium]